jgi:hypothetical protein
VHRCGRWVGGGGDRTPVIRQIHLAFAFLSSLSFLLGSILRSIRSLVHDTSQSYLARTPPSPPPYTIHTSLPLTVGGSKHRPSPNDSHPLPDHFLFTRFCSKRLPFPTSVIAVCVWVFVAYIYLFVSVLFTRTLQKVEFIQCYYHWFYSRNVSGSGSLCSRT